MNDALASLITAAHNALKERDNMLAAEANLVKIIEDDKITLKQRILESKESFISDQGLCRESISILVSIGGWKHVDGQLHFPVIEKPSLIVKKRKKETEIDELKQKLAELEAAESKEKEDD